MRLIFYIAYFFILKIIRHETLGMFIKNVCEKMGVVYIKLAQILSTRSDIFKDDQSRKDLSLINDNCNILEFSEIENILKQEYGNNLYNIFKHISKTPLGCASISQVHKAVLNTGEEVAIKVKRNDILKNIKKDITHIKLTLLFLSIFSKQIRFLYKSKVLDIYLKWILEETDFENERKNIKDMYSYHILLNEISSLKGNKKILLVKLYENLCTSNIILMQYIPYSTINKLELNKKNNKLIQESVNSYLKYYFHALFNFDKAIFHGDPHSGNIFIDDNGNIGFLDFGLVFKFNKSQLDTIKKLAILMYKKDFENLYNTILKLSNKYGYSYSERKKEEKLKSDLRKFLLKIDDINVTNWFMEMAFVFLRNNLFPPEYYYEFGKAFLALDGIILFSLNNTTGYELLYEQFSKYYFEEKLQNFLLTLSTQKDVILDTFENIINNII